jgi:hypothetical protein
VAAVGPPSGVTGPPLSRAYTCFHELVLNAGDGHGGYFPVDWARSRASHGGGGTEDGPTVNTRPVAAAAPSCA